MLQNESDSLVAENDIAEQLIELPVNTSAVDASLQQLYTEYSQYQEEQPFTASNPASNQVSADGEKTVVRITTDNVEGILPLLEEIGFVPLGLFAELNFVEGDLPIDAITQLESLSEQENFGVLAVPEPITFAGSVENQADFVSQSERVRDNIPDSFDGAGVRVGVISDSFDVSGIGSAAADIASGDLPAAGVTVLQEAPNGSDEGRAMLQLVHDIAPGADLLFSEAGSASTFVQTVEDLADPANGNADILVDDVRIPIEPIYQDGPIATAINGIVQNSGIPYFSGAANSGSSGYESTDFAGVSDSSLPSQGEEMFLFHDFDPGAGVDTRQQVSIPAGGNFAVSLQWDDPFFTPNGVDTNLDIFLLDPATNQVLDSSIDNNIANQSPVESLNFANTTGATQQFEVVIRLTAGPAPERFTYHELSGTPFTSEFATNSPTVAGHAAAENVRAVGAVNFFDQAVPAQTSSVGPTTILFDAQGNRLPAPEIRQTPGFAATQGSDTTFFIPNIEPIGDGNSFPNFLGTSAAAPNAAAIAALVKQANPNFTPQQIYERLEATAEDIGTPGRDNASGAGLLNAYRAVFGPVVPATLDFDDNFDDGDLPTAFEVNSTGAGRVEVTNDNEPLGTSQVVLDSSFAGVGSRNELILHIDADNASNLELNFDQKEFDDEDNPLPTSFTGSVDGDGVSLSVDGTNWVRLVDLTGANSTNTFQNNNVNLSQVAADNGLTLSSDTQIKFQQFDDGFATLGSDRGNDRDGFAFDNISVTAAESGTAGKDDFKGTDGNDRFLGLAGDDKLDGKEGDDFLDGGDDDDDLKAGEGNDTLLGGAGNDKLEAEEGDNLLDGGAGDDELKGGKGNDTLTGGAGNDELEAEESNNLLTGGLGNDELKGGKGMDTFVLAGGDGSDVIEKFDDGVDLFQLSGGLSFPQLTISGQDDDALIQVTSTGELLATVEKLDPALLTGADFI